MRPDCNPKVEQKRCVGNAGLNFCGLSRKYHVTFIGEHLLDTGDSSSLTFDRRTTASNFGKKLVPHLCHRCVSSELFRQVVTVQARILFGN